LIDGPVILAWVGPDMVTVALDEYLVAL